MSRAPRFIVPLDGAARGVRATLPSHVAHQVTRVLRLRHGDALDLLDGTGGSWHATLDPGATPATATATLAAFAPPAPADDARHVTLVLGLLKADKFDWVVQKATEVGVARVVPVVMARSVPMAGRADRWRRIAAEATEQCGRTVVPAIDDPVPLAATVALGAPRSRRVICWEDEAVVPYLAAIAPAAAGGPELGPDPLVVWVGPEGGITPDEAAWLRDAGAVTATLGARILRSETAAIVAVALATGIGEA